MKNHYPAALIINTWHNNHNIANIIIINEILTTSLEAPLDGVYIMVKGHHVCK